MDVGRGAVPPLWFLAWERLTLNRELTVPRQRPTSYVFLKSSEWESGSHVYRHQMGLSPY